jgi:hypothetical protein
MIDEKQCEACGLRWWESDQVSPAHETYLGQCPRCRTPNAKRAQAENTSPAQPTQ